MQAKFIIAALAAVAAVANAAATGSEAPATTAAEAVTTTEAAVATTEVATTPAAEATTAVTEEAPATTTEAATEAATTEATTAEAPASDLLKNEGAPVGASKWGDFTNAWFDKYPELKNFKHATQSSYGVEADGSFTEAGDVPPGKYHGYTCVPSVGDGAYYAEATLGDEKVAEIGRFFEVDGKIVWTFSETNGGQGINTFEGKADELDLKCGAQKL